MRKAASFLFLSFLMISGVAAQNNATAQEDQASKNVLVELDEATWISDINWRPENTSNIRVTVHSEIPKTVKIQEIPDYTGQSGSFHPMKSVTLSPGENVIELPVNGRGNLGAGALGVAITDSNDGAYYTKEAQSIPDPGPMSVPFIAFYGAIGSYITFKGLRGLAKFKLRRGYIRE